MKKISFYFTHNPNVKWNPYTVKNVGLGGNYVATWNLARELAALGYDVFVFGHIHEKREDIYDKVRFIDISRLQKHSTLSESDILISCESGIPDEFRAPLKINWIHRNIKDAVNNGAFDQQVFASDFHKEYLDCTEGEIIPNGVDTELFRQHFPKKKNSASFVGHPIKGMQYINKVVHKIREKIPEAVMHTYGDAELWGWDQTQFVELQTDLIKSKVLYHGRTGQLVLARLLHQSKIFLYPSTFQEPFGMAVLEAMSSGCVPVVSQVGNLPELVRGCGFVVEGLPTEIEWSMLAAEKVIQLLTDKDMYREYSYNCVERAKEYSWDKIAKMWEDKFLL